MVARVSKPRTGTCEVQVITTDLLIRIILYEMAYGKRPWEGKGILNLLEAIEKKPLSFPLIPRMREQTINLIKKMLEDKEEERIS